MSARRTQTYRSRPAQSQRSRACPFAAAAPPPGTARPPHRTRSAPREPEQAHAHKQLSRLASSPTRQGGLATARPRTLAAHPPPADNPPGLLPLGRHDCNPAPRDRGRGRRSRARAERARPMRRLPSAAPNELPPPLLPYRARAWRARTGCPPPRDATPPVCTHVEEASQEEVRCGAEGDEELGQEKRGGRDANNAAPEGRRRAHGRPGDPALRSVPCTGPELGPPCGRVAVSARMRLRELRLAEQLGSDA